MPTLKRQYVGQPRIRGNKSLLNAVCLKRRLPAGSARPGLDKGSEEVGPIELRPVVDEYRQPIGV